MTLLSTGFGGALGPLGGVVTSSTHIGYRDTVSETVAVAPTEVVTLASPRTAEDEIGITYRLFDVKVLVETLSQTVGVAPAVLAYYGLVVTENLTVDPVLQANNNIGLALTDGAGFSELLLSGIPLELSETVEVAFSEAISTASELVEGLGLAPLLAPAVVYGLSLTQTIGLVDALTQFLGAEASDSLSLEHTELATYLAIASLAETVGVAPALTPLLLLRVDLEDGVEVTPAEALTMLFKPTLADGVEISAAYIEPGGGLTTWAMNTRTGAVSEYDNYGFNSFAAVGNIYLGASSTGLYELHGEDDVGDDIVARIKSGFLQFGGTHLSRLKSAYLAVRGEGDFVLRIETGHGDTYDYAVSTRDMRSTKVHMGKGQRARYFSFELISEGQDFDLDTLEFVPVVVQRRV